MIEPTKKKSNVAIADKNVAGKTRTDNELHQAAGPGHPKRTSNQELVPLKVIGRRVLDRSPALQTLGTMKDTQQGRCVGVRLGDGSASKLMASARAAAEKASATVKIDAPKVGGVVLADGQRLLTGGQLAGTRAVLFDTLAIVLGTEAAALDFASDAFGYQMAIGVDAGDQQLLMPAGVELDAGAVDARNMAAFITAANTRQWAREATVRSLA